MTFAWLIKNFVGALLLPPGNGLALLLIAGAWRKRRWAFGLAACGALLLLVQSLPIVSGALIQSLERRAGGVPDSPGAAQAIVILGSGLLRDAPDYGGDTANERTLVRTRYGARLAERWHLPVLVSGGRPAGASRSEAAVMGEILEREFGVPVRWREELSLDTADNARFSAVILKQAGVSRIVLVTKAFHMPRAVALFEAAGLQVVPAPTGFRASGDRPPDWFDLVPGASALHNAYYALHEWLGIAWLRLVAIAAHPGSPG
jgi:uncharacterized SAM-binding protein YcdF (DUF218 family)